VFPLDLLAGMMAVVGLLVVFSALNRREKRPELAEHTHPYEPSIADEARRWLDQTGG
jgi:hypothetical protein